MSNPRHPRREVTEFEEIFRGFRYQWLQLKRGVLRVWWSLQRGWLAPLWPPNWFRWIWRSDVCRFIRLPLGRLGLRLSPFREFGRGPAGRGASEDTWKDQHFQPVERERFTSFSFEALKESMRDALREPQFQPTVIESNRPAPDEARTPAAPRATREVPSPRPVTLRHPAVSPSPPEPAPRAVPPVARVKKPADTAPKPVPAATRRKPVVHRRPVVPVSRVRARHTTHEGRGPAWTFASITGTVGVILLFLLLFGSLQTSQPEPGKTEPAGLITPKLASARVEAPAEPEPVFPRPHVAAVPPPTQPVEPDPFPQPEPISPIDYREPAPVISPPVLSLNFGSIPTDPKYFRPVPDDPEEYLVTAGPETARWDPQAAELSADPLAALSAVADNWLRATSGDPSRTDAAEFLPRETYQNRVSGAELDELLAAAKAQAPLPDTADSARTLELDISRTEPRKGADGRTLQYSIVLENRGDDRIDDVTVAEQIPEGARLTGVTPRTAVDGDSLLWRIRKLEPGEKTSLDIELESPPSGTLQSKATVRTLAAVGSTTVVERGVELDLVILAPEQVYVGEECPLQVVVTNTGSATAEDLAIHADLPEELGYHQGRTLIYQVGSLPAGESHTAVLTAVGAGTGSANCVLKVVTTTADATPVEKQAAVDVKAAPLEVVRIGPGVLHRDAEARFENRLQNLTSEPLTDVTVVETVPEGVEVVDVEDGGTYDSATRTVAWEVDRIPADGRVSCRVTLRFPREGRNWSDVSVASLNGSLDKRRFVEDVEPPATPVENAQRERVAPRRTEAPARRFVPCIPRPLVCR